MLDEKILQSFASGLKTAHSYIKKRHPKVPFLRIKSEDLIAVNVGAVT
jgi:hypothetical protein